MSSFSTLIENFPDAVIQDLAGFFRREAYIRSQRYPVGRHLFLYDSVEVEVLSYQRVNDHFVYDVVDCNTKEIHTNVSAADLFPWE